jgi:hypothetical protein
VLLTWDGERFHRVESRDTEEYLAHIVKRNILREAILKAMADNSVEGSPIRRSAARRT